ncbi:MAG TPA: YggT family protein [Actinomycetota bacterium]|nr:YggT family protein [Actinomycetota bacterium]
MEPIEILCIALQIYTLILFARIILSWVTMFWSPPPGLSPAIRLVYDLTEPIMGFFRRYIPAVGGLDLSPIFIFIILNIVSRQIGC